MPGRHRCRDCREAQARVCRERELLEAIRELQEDVAFILANYAQLDTDVSFTKVTVTVTDAADERGRRMWLMNVADRCGSSFWLLEASEKEK